MPKSPFKNPRQVTGRIACISPLNGTGGAKGIAFMLEGDQTHYVMYLENQIGKCIDELAKEGHEVSMLADEYGSVDLYSFRNKTLNLVLQKSR